MAFVPGKEYDVFISYAHADDANGWVASFEAALTERVHVLLGKRPAFWRDKRELTGELDFDNEIKRSIEEAAAMVAVLSPSYFNSAYCVMEREHFGKTVESGLQMGSRFRIIKAIKLPHRRVRQLFESALGFPFHTNPPDEREYLPGESGFQESIDKTARGVKSVLEEIANQKTAIYVAEPAPPGLEAAWTRLCAELARQGFRILPSDRIASDLGPQVVGEEMADAAYTVHLAGPAYSGFAALQITTARTLDKPILVWVSPSDKIQLEQKEYLDSLPSPIVVLSGVPDYRLEKLVMDEVRKAVNRVTPTPPAVEGGQHAAIYLICDCTDPEDSSEAKKLAARLKEELAPVEVHLPESGRDPAILGEMHQRRLTEADAVLFCCGHAHRHWFDENYGDYIRAIRIHRAGKPYRSAAVMPGAPEEGTRREFPPQLTLLQPGGSLEPFLAPLRRPER